MLSCDSIGSSWPWFMNQIVLTFVTIVATTNWHNDISGSKPDSPFSRRMCADEFSDTLITFPFEPGFA